MSTPYQNGYLSFLLGRALEDNPHNNSKRKAEIHPYTRMLDEARTQAEREWERGWKKASEYSQNNRYPTEQEQISLN